MDWEAASILASIIRTMNTYRVCIQVQCDHPAKQSPEGSLRISLITDQQEESFQLNPGVPDLSLLRYQQYREFVEAAISAPEAAKI
jgi:hypothetical protein